VKHVKLRVLRVIIAIAVIVEVVNVIGRDAYFPSFVDHHGCIQILLV
jgi:hypothetical protein